MNTFTKTLIIHRRNISIVMVTLSLTTLAVALVWTFAPHINHRLSAYFGNAASQSDLLFYDDSIKSFPVAPASIKTLPETGGCGCPSCCSAPAS